MFYAQCTKRNACDTQPIKFIFSFRVHSLYCFDKEIIIVPEDQANLSSFQERKEFNNEKESKHFTIYSRRQECQDGFCFSVSVGALPVGRPKPSVLNRAPIT